jgi:hypothetical protein
MLRLLWRSSKAARQLRLYEALELELAKPKAQMWFRPKQIETANAKPSNPQRKTQSPKGGNFLPPYGMRARSAAARFLGCLASPRLLASGYRPLGLVCVPQLLAPAS